MQGLAIRFTSFCAFHQAVPLVPALVQEWLYFQTFRRSFCGTTILVGSNVHTFGGSSGGGGGGMFGAQSSGGTFGASSGGGVSVVSARVWSHF